MFGGLLAHLLECWYRPGDDPAAGFARKAGSWGLFNPYVSAPRLAGTSPRTPRGGLRPQSGAWVLSTAYVSVSRLLGTPVPPDPGFARRAGAWVLLTAYVFARVGVRIPGLVPCSGLCQQGGRVGPLSLQRLQALSAFFAPRLRRPGTSHAFHTTFTHFISSTLSIPSSTSGLSTPTRRVASADRSVFGAIAVIVCC